MLNIRIDPRPTIAFLALSATFAAGLTTLQNYEDQRRIATAEVKRSVVFKDHRLDIGGFYSKNHELSDIIVSDYYPNLLDSFILGGVRKYHPANQEFGTYSSTLTNVLKSSSSKKSERF